jgi:hypothetical protein
VLGVELTARKLESFSVRDPSVIDVAKLPDWSHSDRMIWPPPKVRQRSMADITFSWSRLTCPALALRHAAPWSRKISATSSAGRDMIAGRYADG